MKQPNILLLAGGGLIVVGVLALLGIVLLIRFWLFSRNARRVSGWLVDYEVRDGDGGQLYAPILMYRDEAGSQRQVTFKVATNFRQYQPGDAITLLIHPSAPDDVKIAGGLGHWVFPVMLTLVGTLFAFVAGVGILWRFLS